MPMKNLKLTIEYEGTNYHGWQIQPNALTIQEVIQGALTKLTNMQSHVIGAGRTDAGVHAAGQVAHFQTDSQMNPDEIQRGVNSLLPDDIVVLNVETVPPDFHARFSAVTRTYRYTILNRPYPSAFLRNTAYFSPQPIDVSQAHNICGELIGKGNFSSFQRSGSERSNPICDIKYACCWRREDLVCFQSEADSFLRGMVRAIVGTVLKLQDSSDPVSQLRTILDRCTRSAAGPSAPSLGLSLLTVKYNRHNA